jgi:pyridoxamine 5'-phosphate oxidase
MRENPNVCICFFWDALSKVVRIQGLAEIQDDQKANDDYFHSRPRDAQIASASSNQSHIVVGGRAKVEQNYEVKLKP